MTSLTSRCLISLAIGWMAAALPLYAQQEEDSREKILADQQRLAEQYELLEKKLFSLYQYEQEQNPARSELLQKAFQSSKEKLTLQKFLAAVQQLDQSRFRNAGKSQAEIVTELQDLLDLLQSEDRDKRVKNQINQYKEYLKEINRILRIQQGIRGQIERGNESQRLENEQDQNADRTGDLKNRIQASESGDQQPTDMPSQSGDPPSPGAEGEPGQPGPGQPGDDQAPTENPVQQKLQQAEQGMREARQKMEDAQRDASVEKMREAERELEKAKQELERILRQLREEEIKRTLASLESRFRRMLELQIRIHADTVTLNEARDQTAADEIEIQSGKLATREGDLVTEAARALLVLEDDGSSIAVSESLLQAQQDMQQVVDRLKAARTAQVTQEIQLGIIETLEFLVEVFDEAQASQDESAKGQGQQGQGQPGEQALVNQLAELKLIRGLQKQILTRHTRYSRLLENPTDVVGHTNDPGIQQALEQLGQRQQKLQQITRDIVVGKNR